jgi:ligand-binding sensor domain-containing protein
MMGIIKYIVIILLCVQFKNIYAQLPEIQFEFITAADGLVDDDFIFEIYQDRQGFMWFATFDGLSKYDGYKFTNYRHNPIDSSSLSNSSIFSIYEDPKSGQFWFGTNGGGLNLFNPTTEKFKWYQHNPDDSTSLANNYVRDIMPAGESGLWIATQDGLDYFDFKAKVFTHFRYDFSDSLSLSCNEVGRLYIDKDKTLWVGTGSIFLWQNTSGGLNRFNPETKTFKRYSHLSADDSGLSADNICVINEDQNGTLYVGTGKSTLHKYNREKDSFELLSNLSKQQPFAAYGEGFAGFRPGVWSFIQDIDGYYWVATFSGGLNRFDLKNGFMKHYQSNKDDALILTSKNILALYEDRQGSIWFSSYKNGIHKITPSHNRFHPFAQNSTLPSFINDKDVRAIFEDSFGTFWIGTSINVLRFDPALNAVKNYNEILNFDVRWIDVIHEDASKRLWIGGAAVALTRFDLKSGDVKRYLPDEQDKNSLPFWNVMTISQENDSILWLGSEFDGLAHFDINSEKFKHYTYDPSDTLSISSDKVWITLIDQMNILWIGTNNGLNQHNKETDAFERFLPGVEVHIILEDSNNNFWLGTIGQGLILFVRETGRGISYTADDGLLSNIIYSLAEDDQGFIWIGSAGGLTRLDTKKMSFVSFDEQDGLLNHFTKYSDAVLKTKNGELLFGGNKGITAFSPDQFKTNNFPPYLAITGLSIFDKSYKEKGRLDSLITLDYNQNDLTFEYVGLHFKNPSKNKYMVKLEPYEKEWRVVNTVRSAHYTNLATGNYTFHVKASNSDGVWNEEGASIKIIITPPWWQTWWAYLMYASIFIFALYGIRRYEMNRISYKNQGKLDKAVPLLR